MKIDFLQNIDSDDFANNMLRITSFDKKEVRILITYLETLLKNSNRVFSTTELDFVVHESCEIKFELSDQNKGLYQLSEREFVCDLDKSSYEEMINLLVPFQFDSSGFQFLIDPPINDIELLISYGGGW